MFRQLNKIGGALAAPVLYPAKSLFINILIAIGTVFVALIALVGLPILFARVAYELAPKNKWRDALIWGISSWFVLLIAVPVVTAFILAIQIKDALLDLPINFLYGLVDGYKEGLFFHVLYQTLTCFTVFSNSLRTLVFDTRNIAIDDQNKEDTISQTTNFVSETFTPLTSEEIELAERMGLSDTIDRYQFECKEVNKAEGEQGEILQKLKEETAVLREKLAPARPSNLPTPHQIVLGIKEGIAHSFFTLPTSTQSFIIEERGDIEYLGTSSEQIMPYSL
ncbi:OadG family protein [Legionella micdadei]|uniref:Uncharacterized protein n=1 Tax=Legionella micdadei TaxID=451 RepID=A0A098GFW1_LEGMI|nr:OadG family protein [Legionella micdadei]ARG97560.1 hypothetical protein B6N58_07720 [Legionella micdadei]ARH00127.1 hypothetical protein B6V88_06705 [Legionella micdadei]KTD27639.1 hypothetical protein Lmic_1959 [Legionella micdadei]NSL17622.1 hypothetical protein [Legionella micdadei]CEG60875.1 membrane protein of unknown function [Legionella micdadei]